MTEQTETTTHTWQNLYNSLHDKRSFSYMSEKMLKTLLQTGSVVRFLKGQTILNQGKSNDTIYIILKGVVMVRINGKPVSRLRRTGDILGELSFITSNDSSASVIVEEDLLALRISHSSLKDLGDTHFYMWLCRVLAEKVIRSSP